MSSDESTLSVSSIKRFPAEVREELNRFPNVLDELALKRLVRKLFLRRSSWQCLTTEFSIDVLTGLKVQALDDVADLVDSDYPEF